MDLGLTAEAIGTTTGRTTGMRVNSGRRACTMPTSKPTSLTCWPRPARSRSTEGTELPTGNVRMSSLGLAKDGLPPTNGTLRRPPQRIRAAVGRSLFLSQSCDSRRTSGSAVSTNHGLGRRRGLDPPPPTQLWIRVSFPRFMRLGLGLCRSALDCSLPV